MPQSVDCDTDHESSNMKLCNSTNKEHHWWAHLFNCYSDAGLLYITIQYKFVIL